MNTTTTTNAVETTLIEITVGSRMVRIIDSGDRCVTAYLLLAADEHGARQVNGTWSGSTVAGAKRWAAKELSN
jgi:hypothetical protein